VIRNHQVGIAASDYPNFGRRWRLHNICFASGLRQYVHPLNSHSKSCPTAALISSF